MSKVRSCLLCASLGLSLFLGVVTPALGQSLPLPSAVPETLAESFKPAASPAPSFAGLFEDTIDDFRRLPSRETFSWLAVGVAAAVVGHKGDHRVTASLSGSSGLGEVLEAGETLGGARVQLAGAIATYTLGQVTKSPRVSQVGADLFRAQVVAQALTASVKLSVRRSRPDGTNFSFPSGHTSVSFASATVLQRHFGWKVGIPAYGVASYVAASRIQAKRHFLSDVAFGAALGIVAGRTVTVGRGSTRFALAPMAAPGGAGVSFTWAGQR